MFRFGDKVIMAILAGFAVLIGTSALDRSMNYVETKARITSVAVDCYVESSRHKVVEKGTSKLAYMDCDMAPLVAKKFGHSEADIQKRAQVEYEFRSPVDENYYTGKFTQTYGVDRIKEGNELEIYAHTTEAPKSRLQ